jgi:hypothetical protein
LWGRVDILVATAGVGLGRASSTRSVAPIIEKQGSGKIIITVSSTAGLNPSRDAGYEHYGVAKAPFAHYARFLAQELGPFGITANGIAPALITTDRIVQNVIVILCRSPHYADSAPWRTVREFLATDLSNVTGITIPVVGGFDAVAGSVAPELHAHAIALPRESLRRRSRRICDAFQRVKSDLRGSILGSSGNIIAPDETEDNGGFGRRLSKLRRETA